MPAWPDANAVSAFLARAGRRRAGLAALEGAAMGAAIGALAVVVVPGVAGVALAVLAIAIAAVARFASTRRAPADVARSVERRAPGCRNVVITTAELITSPDRLHRVHPDIGARVCRDAARTVSNLDPRRLYPARRPALAGAGGATALALALWLGQAGATATATDPGLAGTTDGDGSGPRGPAIVGVTADIEPPAYTGRDAITIETPEEIRTLAGSRIRLRVRADATSLQVETIDDRRPVTRDAAGDFVAAFDAEADGFIALTPEGPDGATGDPQLIALVIEPDAAPRVRLTEPGQDLFLPDASMRLPLGVEADDDLGLASLALTYTRVSGSGENFNFVSGEVPLTIARDGDASWSATGALDLAALDLEPGDVIVYRGVAADRRPGALPVESDAFIIEILAPGEAAASGFAIDDQRERYALSQRMVLIKTERLVARRASTSSELIMEEAQVLAAEQRQVRAEFVFMMGGELSEFGENSDPFMLHEEDEAHAESDIAAGRLVNQGRAELTRAIREMSRAATLLTSGDLDTALVAEQAAVDALQRAFSKTRYILRTLSERESIDLERRLSGTIDGVADASLRAPSADGSTRAGALRSALADVLAFAGAPRTTRTASGAIRLAQSVLHVDASSEVLREVAAALTDTARAIERDDAAATDDHLAAATTALAAAARVEAAGISSMAPGSRLNRLRGSQADRVRGGGR